MASVPLVGQRGHCLLLQRFLCSRPLAVVVTSWLFQSTHFFLDSSPFVASWSLRFRASSRYDFDRFLPTAAAAAAAATRAARATRSRRSEKVARQAAESSCPCDIYIPLAAWSPAGAQISRFTLPCHRRSLFAFFFPPYFTVKGEARRRAKLM